MENRLIMRKEGFLYRLIQAYQIVVAIYMYMHTSILLSLIFPQK